MDFHGFVAARSGPLFRGALVLTGNRETAEDLVQETLERICRKWRTIAAKDAPDAYVRRIMVKIAKTQTRLGTVSEIDCGKYGEPGTVIQVDPHTPKTVSRGGTANVTLCAGQSDTPCPGRSGTLCVRRSDTLCAG
ncbi:sigma factor [Streptomyces sp. NBC_00878]|uniref:sigma factor n=1 Tax=Streptomyces sp. NBC_00878 TaxID=2975854 RepID=UPI002255D76A|nr:sigma factor [Streptomyces sp. NBC_00878]MCX4908382.1 hypothetical protein [Streptomyces sp. NBC_00878]